MKKLILIPLLLSLSSCLPQETASAYDPPPVCYANGDPQPALDNSLHMDFVPPMSYKMLSASFSPSDFHLQTFAQQMRVKLNGKVVYNSCRPIDVDGFAMQYAGHYIYFGLDFDRNETWRNDYFHEDGTPKRWGLELQIEQKRNCGGESWQPVLASTAALLDWKESSGPCSLGGYYANLTSPIPLDVTNGTFSDPQ